MKQIILAAALLIPAASFAANWSSSAQVEEAKKSVSLGGRGMYFRPKGADKGDWHGGAQLRIPANPVWSLEGSIDYRENDFRALIVQVYPVQASLIAYLIPNAPVTPYLLGGAGWYHTRIKDVANSTDERFGPHAGAGIQAFMNQYWSLDGSWRYIWISDIEKGIPAARELEDRGYMITAALNYHF